MAERFSGAIRRADGVVIVTLVGDVGLFAQARIKDLIGDAFTEPVPLDVVLDVAAVTYIDRDGLALIEYARRLADGAGITLTVVSGPVVDRSIREESGHDRRRRRTVTKTGARYMTCRLCWTRIALRPERIEIDRGQVIYRCQHCDHPFLIRGEDAAALGVLSSGSDD